MNRTLQTGVNKVKTNAVGISLPRKPNASKYEMDKWQGPFKDPGPSKFKMPKWQERIQDLLRKWLDSQPKCPCDHPICPPGHNHPIRPPVHEYPIWSGPLRPPACDHPIDCEPVTLPGYYEPILRESIIPPLQYMDRNVQDK